MRHQRDLRESCRDQRIRRVVRGDHRAAGATPAPRPDDARLVEALERLDAVERLDDAPLRCRSRCAERRQRDDAARVVRLNVDNPPSRPAHADVRSGANPALGIGRLFGI
jgi:hypothetical protein